MAWSAKYLYRPSSFICIHVLIYLYVHTSYLYVHVLVPRVSALHVLYNTFLSLRVYKVSGANGNRGVK